MSRSTTQIGPVAAALAFAIAKGVPIERVIEVTGLSMTDLVQPDLRLSDEVMGRAWGLLTEAFPDQAIGVEMARAAPFSFFGLLAHTASYAEDLRAAIDLQIRYRRLLSEDLDMGLDEGVDEAALWMRHPFDAVDPNPAPPEATVGLMVRYLREVLAVPEALVRVEFAHARAGPMAVYSEFFACEVHHGRDRNAMILRRVELAKPTGQGDRHRFDFLVAHLDFVHSSFVRANEVPGLRRIRAALAVNARRGEYGAEALARELGMSLRSLQRLTKTLGTSPRELLDEAREAHAHRLLGDPRLSIEEVSLVLGYSAESAFRRAFKRWTGYSPAQARARRLAGLPSGHAPR